MCNNLEGSYRCTCAPNYEGDGISSCTQTLFHSCLDFYNSGVTTSGPQEIALSSTNGRSGANDKAATTPAGTQTLYCDMDASDPGWTLIAKQGTRGISGDLWLQQNVRPEGLQGIGGDGWVSSNGDHHVQQRMG